MRCCCRCRFDIWYTSINIDPQNCRFDHHQRGFNTFFSDKHHVTKLSASGLIYRHFGKRILTEKFAVKPEHLDIVYVAVYDSFLEAIDAIDNGVEICDGKLKYRDNTGLSSRVALLNPTWLDENPNYDVNILNLGTIRKSSNTYWQ